MSDESVLIPIGYYCGPFFLDPARDPEYWQVRIGRATYELPNMNALNMWFLARGVPSGSEVEHSRKAVLAAAADSGMREPDYVLDRLIEARLIVEVGSSDWPLERFAESFTVQPLMVAVGNTPERMDQYTLGLDQEHLYAGLTAEQYDAWVFTQLSRSIRHAAEENVGSQDAVRGRAEILRLTRTVADLVAYSTAYIDVVVGTEVQTAEPMGRADEQVPGVPPVPPLPPDAARDSGSDDGDDDDDLIDDGF